MESREIRAAVTIGTIALVCAALTYAQAESQRNSQPNPYRAIANWANLPAGRSWGQTSAVDVDSHDHVWVADRCGGTSCAGKTENPIFEFDSSGKLLTSFGGGLFVCPHGIFIDRDGNVWITDTQREDGKGQQVLKFSADGRVLLKLGRPGVAGDSPDTLNEPTDVVVAANGDIFVANGHTPGNPIERIMKFSRDGKFIKMWGKKGSAPGELDGPHALAVDSKGRLFVGDRSNNRIEIFDQNGRFLEEWKQFGRPSGLFIDRHDVLYVSDSESEDQVIPWSGQWSFLPKGYGYNPGWKRGIRVGSARDGSVSAFIPDLQAPTGGPNDATSGAEGVAADSTGAIYAAEAGARDLKKYIKP
jgi:hypothetical protein